MAVQAQGLLHGWVLSTVLAARGQHTGLASQHLRPGVAGDAGKGRVHVDDALLGIAHHHAVVCLGHHAGRQTQGVFYRFLGGDVLLDAHVVGGAACRIDQGRHGGAFDVEAAVLAPVDEFALPHLPGVQRAPHGAVSGRRGLPRLQDAGVGAQQLLRAVAGGAEKLRVGVFDGRFGRGDDDAGRALLHRQRQFADGGRIGLQAR